MCPSAPLATACHFISPHSRRCCFISRRDSALVGSAAVYLAIGAAVCVWIKRPSTFVTAVAVVTLVVAAAELEGGPSGGCALNRAVSGPASTGAEAGFVQACAASAILTAAEYAGRYVAQEAGLTSIKAMALPYFINWRVHHQKDFVSKQDAISAALPIGCAWTKSRFFRATCLSPPGCPTYPPGAGTQYGASRADYPP